jgi:uncharacterized protein GlcG (DUF336 family)
MKIPYCLARILASIAEAEALTLGVPMATALVDGEGGLLFFGRMDGTLPASTELAVAKAFTAAALRMATHEVGKLAQPGGVLYGIQHTHPGRIVLFGGGLVLRLQGKVAGAVGISGGTVEEDIRVAKPVVEALQHMDALSVRIKPSLPAKPQETSSFHGLERIVDKEVERMNCPLPPGEISILTGAIILATVE